MAATRKQAPELTDQQLAWLALPRWAVSITRAMAGQTFRAQWCIRAATFEAAAELVDQRLGERAAGEVRQVEITKERRSPAGD